MLPYILAIAVASASFLLFISAFVFPKLHRQDDFLWSGVGLFYALVLWLCAGRLTGGVLLGQGAATCLLLAFGWQTVKLRRVLAYPEAQTDLEGFSLTRWLGKRLSKTPRKPAPPKVPKEAKTQEEEVVVEVKQEANREETVTSAKPGLLSNIFASRKPPRETKPTSLTTALNEAEATEEFEEDWELEAVSETEAIASEVSSVSEETAEPVIFEETEAVESVVGEAEASSEVETDETVIFEKTEAVESVVGEAEASSEVETDETVIIEETEAVESVVGEAEASSEVETDETAIIEETEAVESVVGEAETSGNEPATGEAVATEKTEPQD